MVASERIRVYWQPGCSSCLRTKEFLTARGVDYESINVHGDADAMAALNALTLKLANEVRGDVKVNAGCPGWVRTRMGGEAATSSLEEGADTIVWLATLPASGPSGGFYRHRRLVPW